VSLRLDFDDETLDALAERIAARMPAVTPAASPWMNFGALCEYTSIPEGTLRKMTAAGEVPSHGGRAKLYHRDEVDEALLGYSRRQSPTTLRRIA
jgi:hypothetical protein